MDFLSVCDEEGFSFLGRNRTAKTAFNLLSDNSCGNRTAKTASLSQTLTLHAGKLIRIRMKLKLFSLLGSYRCRRRLENGNHGLARHCSARHSSQTWRNEGENESL